MSHDDVTEREAVPVADGGRLTRRLCLRGLAGLPFAASLAGRSGLVCRPQDFGAVPDGMSDSTGAIRRAIEAVGPSGGRVLLEGGTFCITDQIDVRWPRLAIGGDGALRAGGNELWVARKAMLEVGAPGVRIEGITLDQGDRIPSGDSIRATGAAGLCVRGVTSRNTQRAFVLLGDQCTDVEIGECRHFGRGWGVLAADGRGLARIVVRDCVFEHPGRGSVGDGVEFNCPSHGADTVQLIDLQARGYVGEAKNAGMGFGFCRVRNTLVLRCEAKDCEGDGFHWERGSDDALVVGCSARRIGRPDPVGGNGSGFVAYDCDRWQGWYLEARDCWYHGIALSGPDSRMQRRGGRIRDCAILGTGRDGLHLTAQRDFEIERCLVRDPSRSAPLRYAGIRIVRQNRTLLENMGGRGVGNRIELTGATRPLGGVVIDEASRGVSIVATVRAITSA